MVGSVAGVASSTADRPDSPRAARPYLALLLLVVLGALLLAVGAATRAAGVAAFGAALVLGALVLRDWILWGKDLLRVVMLVAGAVVIAAVVQVAS